MNKNFTVCLLFDEAFEQVLLVRKGRTEFKGKLNGCGGEIEANEIPYEGAIREIEEELGLSSEDLVTFPDDSKLRWLGTLSLPHNCKYSEIIGDENNPSCRLFFYAGVVKDTAMPVCSKVAEECVMVFVRDVVSSGTDGTLYAGNGDLQYFVASGFNVLHQEFDLLGKV